jgi:hypothetical protein
VIYNLINARRHLIAGAVSVVLLGGAIPLAGIVLAAPLDAWAQSPDAGPIRLRDAEGNDTYTPRDTVALPGFPKRENLRKIRSPTHARGRTYYVDEKSITLGQDRITRYTVVVRSASGVNNVVHESMNCSERDIKVLAYGTSQGVLKLAQGTVWRRYNHQGPMAYRAILALDYICGDSHEPLDAATVVQRLRASEKADNELYPDRGDGGEGQ